MRAAARAGAARRSARDPAGGARTSARVARRQVPRPWTVSPVAGVRITQRVLPLDRVGCYVPGGPLSAALVAPDDGDSGARRRRARSRRRLPASGRRRSCSRRARPASRGCSGSAARTRSRRSPTAPTTIPRVDKIVGPGNAYVAAAKALVAADCAIDFYAGPSEIAVVSSTARPAGSPPISSRRPSTIPTRGRSCLRRRAAWRAAVAARDRQRRCRPTGPPRRARGATAASSLTRSLDEAIALCQRLAPEHVVCDTDAVAARLTRAGTVFVGDCSAQACGDYVDRLEPRAADQRRRAARGGLSAADFVRVIDGPAHRPPRACGASARRPSRSP